MARASRFAVDQGAGGVGGRAAAAVGAVGVGGERRDAGCPASAIASASAYSWFGPPRPLPRIVTVSSPPDRITARRPCALQVARERACSAATVARLAFDAVAEQDALVAGGANRRFGRAERIGRPRDQL